MKIQGEAAPGSKAWKSPSIVWRMPDVMSKEIASLDRFVLVGKSDTIPLLFLREQSTPLPNHDRIEGSFTKCNDQVI